MAINYFMTWRSRPSQYEVPIIQAAPLSKEFADDPPVPESRLKDKPVLDVAHKLDVWEQAQWHRVWERLPIRFTVWVTIAVVVASALELIPTFLIRSNVPTIASVKPYTPLELAGRDIYVSEGCYNCHSQQIRPLFAETERYGEYSKAGEFIYDRPFQWGSRRIGPDLAREGGKQSHLWHFEHFREPSAMVEGSVMPAYPHLMTTELNFRSIQDRVNAAHMLGAPYERELDEAGEMAQEQARQIAWELVQQGGPSTVESGRGGPVTLDKTQMVALIAYLQRIGTDLNATESEEEKDIAPLSTEEQQSMAKYKKMLHPDSLTGADTVRGREVFKKTCGNCHQLFGEGGMVGPSLTETRRWNLDFLLLNSIAPSREILETYKTEVVLTIDGLVLTGVIAQEDDDRIILMTADQPRVEILKDDIEQRKTSEVSVMPTGQLDQLEPKQVQDLFKYLQLPKAPEETTVGKE